MFRSCSPTSNIHYYENLVCGNTTAVIEVNEIFCGVSDKPYHSDMQDNNYNDLANLMIIPAEQTLKLLFSRTEGLFGFQALITYFFCYFVFVVLTSGLAIASGLFVPMMLLGTQGKDALIYFPRCDRWPNCRKSCATNVSYQSSYRFLHLCSCGVHCHDVWVFAYNHLTLCDSSGTDRKYLPTVNCVINHPKIRNTCFLLCLL